jgi:hypothetical protein
MIRIRQLARATMVLSDVHPPRAAASPRAAAAAGSPRAARRDRISVRALAAVQPLSRLPCPTRSGLVQLGPERWLVHAESRSDGAASDSRARSSRSRNACASAESRMPQSESTASHIRYGLAERVTRERRAAADGGFRAAVAPPLAGAKRVTAPGRDPLRRLRLRRRPPTPARPLPDVRRERMGGGEAARPPRGSFVTPTCRSSRATSSIRLTRASSTAS